MRLKQVIFMSFAACFVFLNTALVNADNGLIYPPDDNSNIYQYPSQNQLPRNNTRAPVMSGNLNNGYQAMPNYQRPMYAPSSNIPPLGMQQRPPYGVQNNRVMPNNYNPGFNNQSSPFGNNMPFGNNSGNNFNPFSGGNMPFGNNSGNNFNPFSGGNMPFGSNSGNNFNPFSGGNMPFGNNSGNNFNPFSGGNMPFANNNNNSSLPFFKQSKNNRKKAWGDERNIWPDFYTDFTDDAWDTMSSGPRDLGVMPGGWRFPHISTPDPVTVSDAITNQFPPMAEEGGNMMDFSDWGVFDEK
jgi:hypothetical protein